MSTLRKDLARVLNSYSAENESGTADVILADFVIGCLESFDKAVQARDHQSEGLPPELSAWDRDQKKWRLTDMDEERVATCNLCHAEIRWQKCRTRGGPKNLPMDLSFETVGDEKFAECHLGTCPVRNQNATKQPANALGGEWGGGSDDPDDTPF